MEWMSSRTVRGRHFGGGLDRALGGFVARGAEGEGEIEGEAEVEFDFEAEAEAEAETEYEWELEEEYEEEGEGFVNPIRRIYRDAELMAHLSARAARPRARTRPRRSSARWCPSPPASSRARAGSSRATRPRAVG